MNDDVRCSKHNVVSHEIGKNDKNNARITWMHLPSVTMAISGVTFICRWDLGVALAITLYPSPSAWLSERQSTILCMSSCPFFFIYSASDVTVNSSRTCVLELDAITPLHSITLKWWHHPPSHFQQIFTECHVHLSLANTTCSLYPHSGTIGDLLRYYQSVAICYLNFTIAIFTWSLPLHAANRSSCFTSSADTVCHDVSLAVVDMHAVVAT
jgi:hypothetical protein